MKSHILHACRPDVKIITPNPKTAGVARWNFLALWGHKMKKGDGAAIEYCKRVSFCTLAGMLLDHSSVCLSWHTLSRCAYTATVVQRAFACYLLIKKCAQASPCHVFAVTAIDCSHVELS